MVQKILWGSKISKFVQGTYLFIKSFINRIIMNQLKQNNIHPRKKN